MTTVSRTVGGRNTKALLYSFQLPEFKDLSDLESGVAGILFYKGSQNPRLMNLDRIDLLCMSLCLPALKLHLS